MHASSRRSRLALPLVLGIVLSQASAGLGQEKVAEKHGVGDLNQSLREVINVGAELFNKQADYVGCYRVYQGGLLSVKPLLAADFQKKIDEAIRRAEMMPQFSDRSFELRRVLDEVRAHAKRAAATTQAAPPVPQPEAKAPPVPQSEPKAPEVKLPETKTPEVKLPEKKQPDGKQPERKVPETVLPERKDTDPEKKASEFKLPEKKAPEIKLPEKAPEVKLPEVKAPEVKLPEVKAPEVGAPEVRLPEKKAPEAPLPERKEPEITLPERKEVEFKLPERKELETKLPESAPEIELPEAGGIEKAPESVKAGNVSGVVRFRGKPLPGGARLTLVAEGRTFTTPVQPAGEFRFPMGVPAGPYRVVVEPAADDATEVQLPGQYRNTETTSLTVDVMNGSQVIDLNLVN